GLVTPSGREERTDWPIDHSARQHLLFRRLPLAFEEATGYPSRGVRVLAVIDRERKKVDALARAGRMTSGHEDNRIAEAYDHGSVRLFCELACFETKSLLA